MFFHVIIYSISAYFPFGLESGHCVNYKLIRFQLQQWIYCISTTTCHFWGAKTRTPSPLRRAEIPRFCVSGWEIKDSFFGSLRNITFSEEVFLHWLWPWVSSWNSHARRPLGTGRRLTALRCQGQIIRPSTNGPECFSKETWHSVQKILKSYYTPTSFRAINSSEIIGTRHLNDANSKWSAH